MTRLLLTLLFAITLTPAHAEDYQRLFEEAVAAIDWELEKDWAFTESRQSDDGLWVGRFDPRNAEDERWTLVSVDGRKPTDDELREFAHRKEDHETSGSRQRMDIVGTESIELLEETDEHWLFEFTPDEDEIEFVDSVDSTLKIIKDGRYLEAINIRNHSDITPGFGTKIGTFIIQLQFGPASDAGPIVLRATKVQVSGRALLFIGFDETEIIEYSNFEFAGEAEISAIETLADEVLAAMMERNPTMGTYLGIEGARHDRLVDNSLEALASWKQQEDDWLARLNAIPAPEDIGSRDWVSYGILHEFLASTVASRICRNELWQASATTAWYRSLPFIFEIQPVDTPDLQQQTLARLAEVDRFIDAEIANLRQGLELGYSAPRVTAIDVPDQVRALDTEDTIFLDPGKRADDDEFAASVQTIYDEQIAPAIHRFADFMENDYLPNARDEIALSANPNGDECYPTLVRSFATIQPSADEIHNLGLQQTAKIRDEMRVTIDEHFGGGSIDEFLRRINEDPEFTFATSDAVLQFNLDALDAAKDAMAEAFGRLPKADVLVKPYPEFAESGVGEYHPSSEDSTRPGIFYIAVTDPTHRSQSVQKSTLYHETFPGHHLQGAISLELGDAVHPIARYFWNSGFGEGWALYSERLADELGLYTSPLDRIGLYSDQGARAARLVIDTGLHTKGWTRQQAVDYMMANTSWAQVDIENDINRYISWPGQATSYMLGMLEIRRLRTLAEEELGDEFDLSEFHDRVVGFGGITLPMLHVSILAWIEEQKAES